MSRNASISINELSYQNGQVGMKFAPSCWPLSKSNGVPRIKQAFSSEQVSTLTENFTECIYEVMDKDKLWDD